MADLGKYPLDDDELDKVIGGVEANQECNCEDFSPKYLGAIKSCSNCSYFRRGACSK